ncbi:MAG: hypothetical protein ACLUDF_10170 [Butyricicoccus sp.]
MDAAAEAILREQALETFGVCSFACIQAHLLSCRAAARLPEHPRSVLVSFPLTVFLKTGAQSLPLRLRADSTFAGAVLKDGIALRQKYPENHFEPFIDNSPVPEVEAAVRAGLGCRGDNGLLLHPLYGSYVFIGTIVTDRYWEAADVPLTGCRHCGACKADCPAGCIGRRPRRLPVGGVAEKDTDRGRAQMLRANGLAWGRDAVKACPATRNALIRPHPCLTGMPWLCPISTVGG